jgi:hypothetical protein
MRLRVLRKFRIVSLCAERVVLFDCGFEHLGIHFHLPGKFLDGVCAKELLRVEREEALQLLIEIMELSAGRHDGSHASEDSLLDKMLFDRVVKYAGWLISSINALARMFFRQLDLFVACAGHRRSIARHALPAADNRAGFISG